MEAVRRNMFRLAILLIVAWSIVCAVTLPAAFDKCEALATAFGVLAVSFGADCKDAALWARFELWGIGAAVLGVFALLIRPRPPLQVSPDLPVRNARPD